MKKNREGYLISEALRECTKCHSIFKKTSKTVTLCPSCNSSRVKSTTPEAKMLQRAKNRARNKNLELNLDIGDIKIPEYCPIMGIKLECHTGRSGGKKDSPSLDRKDPNKGYTKDNVEVISHLANMMKSLANEQELKTFAKWINSKFPD
jgi:hypothetical protein